MKKIKDFNPRSHERSDQLAVVNCLALAISIHAPTRGATKPLIYKALRAIISIHAPTRGATSYYFLLLLPILFQSTLPREERPQPPNIANTTIRFQSTLPREERPVPYVPVTRGLYISIHAPTRGATSTTF